MNPTYIAIGFMAVGLILTLVSAYQMYKRGILMWLVLIIVGITAINYGYNQQGSNADDFLDQLNVGKLSRFSKEKLKAACSELE